MLSRNLVFLGKPFKLIPNNLCMRISDVKKQKISEQILAFLYSSFPNPLFTSQIAFEIARDEEFVKDLLISLRKRKLAVEVKKNPKGMEYLRRSRWKMSDEVYSVYRKRQSVGQ